MKPAACQSQQVFPYSLVVYSTVEDDKQKEWSPNKVGGEGLCFDGLAKMVLLHNCGAMRTCCESIC